MQVYTQGERDSLDYSYKAFRSGYDNLTEVLTDPVLNEGKLGSVLQARADEIAAPVDALWDDIQSEQVAFYWAKGEIERAADAMQYVYFQAKDRMEEAGYWEPDKDKTGGPKTQPGYEPANDGKNSTGKK